MNGKGKDAAQRMLAMIVIVAMLAVMGIPPSVIIFFAIVTFFIWRAVQRTEQQELGRIFEFYAKANDILRDEERRWYGFEVAEVIEDGERVLHAMIDPPPLVHFALGSLYHYAGKHEEATEHLAYVVENEHSDERQRFSPSPELRRYVRILRKLERDPSEAPQVIAAMRSLDRARRTRAPSLLEASRAKLNANQMLAAATEAHAQKEADAAKKTATVLRSNVLPPAAPPPIAEVLRNVYEEEKKTA
jgi:hypothetical protein